MKHKFYKRQIKATLHRRKGNSTVVVWERYLSSVTSALQRGIAHAILSGEPGDVLELSSSNYGYLIATLKLKLGAKDMAGFDIQFHIKGVLNDARTAVGTVVNLD